MRHNNPVRLGTKEAGDMRHIEHMVLVLRHHGQHYLSPLHIFCRMKDCGMTSNDAARWAARYERWVYRYTPFA